MTRFIKLAALLIAFPALLTVSAGAHAQSKLLSLQVGVGSLMSSSARNASSSTGIHAGAALNLSNGSTLFVLPGTQGIDADYNTATGHGGHVTAYGLTYTNRISLIPKIAQPLTARTVPYVGFGIGVFKDDVKKQVTTTSIPSAVLRGQPEQTTTTTTTQSHSTTSLGGKLIAGVDFPGNVFLEASYIISGSTNGVRTDSLNLAVGAHF